MMALIGLAYDGECIMDGDFSLAWESISTLLYVGVTVGIVLAVLAGSIKLGFKYAPWLCAFAFLVWFFS